MLTKHHTFPCACPPQTGETSYTFLDIETTGLKRDASIIYLIGCGFHADSTLHIIQWFNDDGTSEPEMLRTLQKHLTARPAPLFTFNGKSFDIPYLNRHYELNDMAYRLPQDDSLDLYRTLKPFQTLYRLPHGKQRDWEAFLGICREDLYQGGELIRVYKEYLKTKDDALLHLLLLHNTEDIRGMEALLPLTAYEALLQSDCIPEPEQLQLSGQLTAICRLRRPLPKPLRLKAGIREMAPDKEASCHAPICLPDPQDAVFDAAGQTLRLSVPYMDGEVKYFYPDYKNYYYLPEEDRAIHKSVGCYVDSRFREQAKPSTCYIRKQGVFLPVFPAKCYKGIRTSQNASFDTLPLYRKKYRDSLSYVELQPLLAGDPEILLRYLQDVIKNILIAKLRASSI